MECEKDALNHLNDVLVLAGCDANHTNAHIARFSEGIRGVVGSALKLREIVGEHITSVDLQVEIASSGKPFDPQYMENSEPPNRGHMSKGAVLCTLALGLNQVEGNPKRRKTLLLKPKVMVDSLLNELGISQGGEVRCVLTWCNAET